MARPKPSILIELTDKETYKTTQVVQSYGIWAVFYKDQPFNLKSLHLLSNENTKYSKTSYPNKGHALRLAKELNEKFKCDDFSTVLLGPA